MSIRRRDFITLLGSAASWPIGARAQQAALPVVGFLNAQFPGGFAPMVAGFRQGLAQAGYTEGRNIAIEFRWAEGRLDRLPALAAELIRQRPAVIFANGPPAVRAVMSQTTTLPIVFSMGEDPVKEGVVASFNRPGGNVTGFTWLTNLLFPKRLGLLRDTLPEAKVIAMLVNPNNVNAKPDSTDARNAASALGRDLYVLNASSDRDFENAFATMVQRRVGALLVGVDGFFLDRRDQLVALAARNRIPALYDRREYVLSGGLMSYGADQVESFRQAGRYVGRILKGEKPADLPVQEATRAELIINLKTAKALNLDIPPGISAIADEVIE